MSALEIDLDLLRQFEKGLDPRFPERNRIRTRVLGYGEISTVLEIGDSTQVTVKGLVAGDYAFAVTAVDMAGNESDFSEPLLVTVGP